MSVENTTKEEQDMTEIEKASKIIQDRIKELEEQGIQIPRHPFDYYKNSNNAA